MARPPGLPKTGGRAKGVPNRKTLLLREVLNDLGVEPVEKLLALLPKLSPSQQADIWIVLLNFTYARPAPLKGSVLPEEAQARLRADDLTDEERMREIIEMNRAIAEIEGRTAAPDLRT